MLHMADGLLHYSLLQVRRNTKKTVFAVRRLRPTMEALDRPKASYQDLLQVIGNIGKSDDLAGYHSMHLLFYMLTL